MTAQFNRIQIADDNGDQISWVMVAGDFCTPFLSEEAVAHGGAEKLFSDGVLGLLHAKDISMVNVESPLTNRYSPIKKVSAHIASPSAASAAIKRAGFDIAVLANNHIMDHGWAGLCDTVQSCVESNIATVGAGSDEIDAQKPLFLVLNGRRMAVLAFAENEFSSAGKGVPGAAKFEPLSSGRAVKDAKAQADLVIVSVHGGNEYYPLPSPRFQVWCRHMVDCGADAVIAHHQHVAAAMEVYRGSPIMYSVGHFLFNWPVVRPKCWYDGMICRLGIQGGRVTAVEIAGCEQIIEGDEVFCREMNDERQEWFFNRFTELCHVMDDPERAGELWKCFCNFKKPGIVSHLAAGAQSFERELMGNVKKSLKRRDPAGMVQNVGDWVVSKIRNSTIKEENLLRIKNLLTCPSHQDVISTIMEMEISGDRAGDDVQRQFQEMMKYCTC